MWRKMPNPKSANLDDQTLKRPKISSLSLSLVKPIQKPIDKHPEKLLAMVGDFDLGLKAQGT